MNKTLFEEVPDRRNTNSLKWGKYNGRDVIPLWVADMDFRSPPEVIEKAIEASSFGHFGYAKCPSSLVEIVVERTYSQYQWEIEPNSLVWLPGMVCALNACCRALEKNAPKFLLKLPYIPLF